MSSETHATLRLTHRFSASPERVFDAWLDPAKVSHWMIAPNLKMSGSHDEIVRIESDARQGGRYSFVVRRQGEDVDHTGEYVEFERPRRLAFTWGVPKYSPEASLVTLDLVPEGTGTLLTLTAERIPQAYAEGTRQGWGAILEAVDESLAQ